MNHYIFIDESGDLGFSETSSKFWIAGAMVLADPSWFYHDLADLKYDLMAKQDFRGERFHAAADRQEIRDRVFDIIGTGLDTVRLDFVVVEKWKTDTAIQSPLLFYPRMLGYLLEYVFNGLVTTRGQHHFCVVTDTIPVRRTHKAVEKALKTHLASLIPGNATFRVLHVNSGSNFNIQIVDYCAWAVMRKWRDGDTRSYNLIRNAIHSEYDVFSRGRTDYG